MRRVSILRLAVKRQWLALWLELRVEWLNKALGRPLKPDWGKPLAQTDYDKASFYVDHQLGGYRLECAGNPVFGHQRMTKNELCNQLEAILTAIRLARGENSGGAWPMEAEKSPVVSALDLAQATIERLQRHAPGSANGTLDVIKAQISKLSTH